MIFLILSSCVRAASKHPPWVYNGLKLKQQFKRNTESPAGPDSLDVLFTILHFFEVAVNYIIIIVVCSAVIGSTCSRVGTCLAGCLCLLINLGKQLLRTVH